MLWVAAKALNISPFSSAFEHLSDAQITWAIANYYKDQEEELEKYKLVCRFINPQAASEIWDKKTDTDAAQKAQDDAAWQEILAHTKSGISAEELKKRVLNPEAYAEPEDNLDKIEVVR